MVALRAVPFGRVATYGQIAALAGNPQGARQVVWLLNSHHERGNPPWHRIINAQGRIALKGEGARLQRRLLAEEGIAPDKTGRIDLARYQWRPGPGSCETKSLSVNSNALPKDNQHTGNFK